MSAQSTRNVRSAVIAAGACLAAMALLAHHAWGNRARETNPRAALQALTWNLPVATSVSGAPRCDSVALGNTTMHCTGSRTAERDASPVLLAAVSGASSLPLAESRHMLALVDLWYAPHDSAARARALRGLREAVVLAPDAAPALTDLSAALLLEHAQSDNVADLLESIDAASRALQVDPASSAAAWNRAVALTRLGLHDQAQSAWLSYARVSAVAPPAVTPATDALRLSIHDAAMDGRWIEASRKYFWNTLLRTWGEGVLAGDSSRVFAIGAVIDSLARRSQDRDTRDSPAAIAPLLRQTSSVEQRRSLAAGFIAIAELRDAHERSDVVAAQRALKRTREASAFQASFSRWTEFERVNLLLRIGNTNAARREFAKLVDSTTQSAPTVARRAAWDLALTYLTDGQVAVAIDSLQVLLPRCAIAREEECVVAVGATLSGAQSSVGDEERALSSAGRAVGASSQTPLTQRRWTALGYLRLQAARLGFEYAYDDLTSEEIAVAKTLGRVDLELLTSRLRAERLLAKHDLVAGSAEVADLERAWRTRASPAIREEFRWDVLWMRGELARQQHAPHTVELLDSAVRASETNGSPARSYPIRLARARARMTAGDSTKALAEFDSLLMELRSAGRHTSSVLDVVRLAEVSRAAANESARGLLAKGFAVRALDALSGRPFGVTRTLPPFDQRVESMAVRELGDSLIVWHRTRDSVHVAIAPLGVRALASIVHELDSATLGREYDALIRPWTSALQVRPTVPLRVDARGVAAGVPWAALRDPTSGTYLIEQREITLVDDALGARGEVPGTRPSIARVLLIDAVPRVGARALPGAARELKSLMNLWGSAAQLMSPASVSVPLERAMAASDLVHFAGHAQIDDRNPERSALSITTSHGDSLIRADAIARWRLPRTRLVVLSACETRVAGRTPLGGLESLAGVLRSVGVQSVIGAGWPVDDRATTDLMRTLHEQLHHGASPSSALRAAQLEMLRSPDHARRAPRVWAAFQLTGS